MNAKTLYPRTVTRLTTDLSPCNVVNTTNGVIVKPSRQRIGSREELKT